MALLISVMSFAQMDTLRLSSSFTTHVIFPSDLSYVDLSDTQLLAAMIVEQNKNVLAIKAKSPFKGATSVTAIESDRKIHTYIVVYEANPRELVIDYSNQIQAPVKPMQKAPSAKQSDAKKSIEEVYSMKQGIYHLHSELNDIEVSCDNILSYGDVTYISLSLKNGSSTDYQIAGATFCIEPKKKAERTAMQPKAVFARNRYGSLSASAGQSGHEVYSFDKMTLAKGQILRVYFYESDDQRNLILDLDYKDINDVQKLK